MLRVLYMRASVDGMSKTFAEQVAEMMAKRQAAAQIAAGLVAQAGSLGAHPIEDVIRATEEQMGKRAMAAQIAAGLAAQAEAVMAPCERNPGPEFEEYDEGADSYIFTDRPESVSAGYGAIWASSTQAPPVAPEPPPRQHCACGQEIAERWRHLGSLCGDCRQMAARRLSPEGLDARIAAAKVPDADPTPDWTAWAHPGSEGP